MKQSWYKGLDKDQTSEIKMSFKSALILRKRLISMLEDKELENIRAGRNKDGYDCPNWAYKQADLQGYLRALNDVINLIK